MAKYAKSKKRAEQKGWRPASEISLSDDIKVADIDRMEKILSTILENNHRPNESELVLLEQAKLICLRTEAYQRGDVSLLNEMNEKLARHNSVLHQHGFWEKRDITPLNVLITRRKIYQKQGIEELLKKVEGKMKN